MKIGITIPNYYEPFLKEIANLNGSNKTNICSLIVENFLSYNLKQKKYPLFRKNVSIVFANEKVSESNSDNVSNHSGNSNPNEDSEQPSVSWSDLTEQLESYEVDDEVVDPDGLPF